MRVRDVLAVFLLCEGRRAQGRDPRCVRCGYSLVGLKASMETRCPECGEGMTADSYPVAGEELLPVGRWVIWVARVEAAAGLFAIGMVCLPWEAVVYPGMTRWGRRELLDTVWRAGAEVMLLPLMLSVVVLVGSRGARDRFMPWVMCLIFVFLVLMWPTLGRT